MRAKDHPLHRTYEGMIERCYYKRSKRYHRYGGRGIEVCERWQRQSNKKATGFWNFVHDMGDRPKGFTLNRIDNDGPYSPDNCEWANNETQTANRNQARGSRHGNSMLTEEQVAQIKVELSTGKVCKTIGDRYGVSPMTIQDIKGGKTWRHVS